MTRSIGAAIVLLTFGATTGSAQSLAGGRVVLEPVAAINTSSDSPGDPLVVLDFTAMIRLAPGLDLIARPWEMRLPGGDWSTEMYQLQIRYQTSTRVPVRIDAGIISSPLGLATLQLRPDQTATVNIPFYFFLPLPSFDGYYDDVVMMSGGYPLGIVASTSGTRWDARVGVVDGTVTRKRRIFHDGPSAAAQFVAGGGFTLAPGVRIGAGLSNGRYRAADDLASLPTLPFTAGPARPASALVFNLEGEAAFRHTALSAEWMRDRFETAAAPAVARGFRVEAVQTLTPRIFGAGRVSSLSSPAYTPVGRKRLTSSRVEATVGYRLVQDLTIRGGYEATRFYGAPVWSHAAVTSLVFSSRWF